MFLFWDVFIDLSSQLEEERNEVQRLEAEKKEWLSRGVHAEFEKKDKVRVYKFILTNLLADPWAR